MSHLNPGPDICISLPSRWRLTSIHARTNAAQLHPGPISNPYWSASSPSRSCPTCIQVKRFLYHRDPCTVSPPPKSHITFCQSTRCAAQVHQCPVSTPKPIDLLLNPFRVVLTSIQVVYHPHPGSDKFHLHLGSASPASRSKDPYIITIHVSSHLHPGHISPSFISQSLHLKLIHVQSLPHPKSHFHPFHVSPPSRSR